METTICPECSAAARIEWRAVLESSDGPVEHGKVRCENRHWFLLPLATLADHAARARQLHNRHQPTSRAR